MTYQAKKSPSIPPKETDGIMALEMPLLRKEKNDQNRAKLLTKF
jgi:hypothetical protein